jgi:pyruvate-formate lyase-activating enzyme
MKNIFDSPTDYLKEIINVRIPFAKRNKYTGKSLICVWLTKLCPVGCEDCFFKSNMYYEGVPNERYQFSDYGLERLIEFINNSNNGYLMLSGGGEPLIKRDAVMEIVRRAKTDRIIVVTSGLWATSYMKTQKIISDLYKFLKNRNDNTILELRLSVDKFHYSQLGFDVLNNVINVFREHFQDAPNFELRIHSIVGDKTINEVAELIGDCEIIESDMDSVSNNEKVIKIVTEEATMCFKDNYQVKIERSMLFFPNLMVDLNTISSTLNDALKIFEKDMNTSEYGNPSVVRNENGDLGLDFWVNYNGNVTVWGNQQLDNLYNVYVDDYQRVVEGTFNNIISYSFLDKGYHYREEIIQSINPKAVLRSKAINLRDFASAFLLEEEKTRLYYGIRVIKDYLGEGVLENNDVQLLPPELKLLIYGDLETLNRLYHEAKYDILTQYMNKKDFNENEWRDLFFLINLGHYFVDDTNLQNSINYYNSKTEGNLCHINELAGKNDEIQYGRLLERISFMKPEAKQFCMKV